MSDTTPPPTDAGSPDVVALLLAGGEGLRAEQGGPKQMVVLPNGSTVLEHAVDVFLDHPRVDHVVLVVSADLVGRATEMMPRVTVVAGDSTRQGSAAAGLAVVDDAAWVLIHDVARPFVPPAVIDRCLDALSTCDAVGTVLDSVDTVYRVRPGGQGIAEVLDRALLRRAQTPQAFHAQVIKDAHHRAEQAGSDLTDDCSVVAMHRPDVPIALVQGDERNIKLTTASDFAGVRGDHGGGPVT